MTQSRFIKRVLSLVIASCLAAGSAGAALAGSDEDHHGGGARTVAFSATGVGPGQATSSSAPGCQFGGTCVVESSGAALVVAGAHTFPASYHSTLSIDYSHPTFPTPGTFCAPASGPEVLTSLVPGSHDTIHKSLTGMLCGGTGVGAPHTFTGSYVITGGSGRFAGATGSGTVTATDNGSGTITSSVEKGTITLKGARESGGEGDDNGGDHGEGGGGD